MEIDQSLGLKRDTLFDKVVLYTAVAMFGMTIVLATIQVVVRVFSLPIPRAVPIHWTEPAARFILIVATYLGAAVATRNDEHISIQFLTDRLKNRYTVLGKVIDVLVSAITVATVLVALYGTLTTAVSDWNTSIGGIDLVTSGNLYLGISVGLFLMLIYELLDASDNTRTLIVGTDSMQAPRRQKEGE